MIAKVGTVIATNPYCQDRPLLPLTDGDFLVYDESTACVGILTRRG